MKSLFSMLAFGTALALAGPVMAEDTESPMDSVQCEKGGGIWNDETKTCDRG